MDDQSKNINPWADKLQNVGFTESFDSWKAMEALLDAEIPVHRTGDYRRWALLSILMLLLIGVCNCPGLSRFSNHISRNNNTVISENGDSTAAFERSRSTTGPSHEASPIVSVRNGEDGFPVKDAGPAIGSSVAKQSGNLNANHILLKKRKQLKTDEINLNKINSDNPVASPAASQADQNDSGGIRSTSLNNNTVLDSPRKKSVAVIKPKKATVDSTLKKQKKDDATEDAKGFALAIGLNQFFPVGDQDKANFNSNGTSGNISDYIPVPAVRYYFHKWLYVEAEAQFNSPQYTKTLLIGQGEKQSTFSPPSGQPTIQSVFIRKLFYLNIPLSVHYSPVRNLFAGVGIQFSRLANGVALFQETNGFSGFRTNVPASGGDTALISSTVENFKNDTTYKKLQTTEWRFLVDVNYQWQRLALGLRYNQAFTDFVNVHVSTANVVTQAHNSSLQLYLQYMIWDKRKRFFIPK